jgi:hypothetical protein
VTLAWSFILAGVGIIGLWIAGRKNAWGWAIGAGAQVLWIIYAVATQQWGFIASALAYGFVYIRNFVRWRAEKRIDKEQA